MRGFLRICAAAISGTLLATTAVAQTMPNGVAAGDVTERSVNLWTRTTMPGRVLFEVSTDPDFTSISNRRVARAVDALQPVRVRISRLTPGTQYYYRATDVAGTQMTGSFRTPHSLGALAGLRFGVSGDSRGDNAPYYSATNVASRDLDFVVNLGDTVYCDIESPILPGVQQAVTLEEFRLKNSEIYSATDGVNALADARASTVFFATIDDHEVTNDFSGGADPLSDPRFDPTGAYINETELYGNGLRAFQEYNPIRDEYYGDTGDARTADKRKLYRYRTFGSDAAILVLDARSFRDPGLVAANVLDPADVIRFLVESFDASRTMLGRAQLDDLKADLDAAQDAGVTWKFVFVPEPIQNLGPLAASDRFEGYAAERTEILRHVHDNGITNVVFVAADIHGTLVNNLTFQDFVGFPQIATTAFEITTGPWAFDAPFGPTVVEIAFALGLLDPATKAFYDASPVAVKEAILAGLVDTQISSFGYDLLGLDGSPVQATLLSGGWSATHTYGWTEFEIDATTQELLVTTYGVTPGDPLSTPTVQSQFVVTPQ